jgi:hypothetical protein
MVSRLVLLQHHRVGTGPAEGPEPFLGLLQQGTADALTSAVWCDGQPVQVAPPSVPSGDDSADQTPVFLREDQRVWVAINQVP